MLLQKERFKPQSTSSLVLIFVLVDSPFITPPIIRHLRVSIFTTSVTYYSVLARYTNICVCQITDVVLVILPYRSAPVDGKHEGEEDGSGFDEDFEAPVPPSLNCSLCHLVFKVFLF